MGCPGPLRAYLVGQRASSGNNIFTVSLRGQVFRFSAWKDSELTQNGKMNAEKKMLTKRSCWQLSEGNVYHLKGRNIAHSSPAGTLLAPSVVLIHSQNVFTCLSTAAPLVIIIMLNVCCTGNAIFTMTVFSNSGPDMKKKNYPHCCGRVLS